MPIFIVLTINEEINFHPSKYLSNLRSESILGEGTGMREELKVWNIWEPDGGGEGGEGLNSMDCIWEEYRRDSKGRRKV